MKIKSLGSDLKENDFRLLALCHTKPITPTDISKILKIAPKNITARIKKLEERKLIKIIKKGREKFIQSTYIEKTEPFLKELLTAIQKNNGEMNYNDFLNTWGTNLTVLDNNMENKIKARHRALFEGYLVQKVVLTDKGKQFLK